MTPLIISVADVEAVPWQNGGGVTRVLLTWPEPTNWVLRISVAEIRAAGAFSLFPGVDRWFAVLSGGGVQLQTIGSAPVELNAAADSLHAFSGDAATHCTTRGANTHDFNVMVRRARGRLTHQALAHCPALTTTAAAAALFVVQPVIVAAAEDRPHALPGMSLAWWPNPKYERRVLRVANGGTQAYGWWLEINVA